MKQIGLFLGFVLLLSVIRSAAGAELTVKVEEKEAPAGLAGPIGKALQKRCIQIFENDKPVYQFWFRTETPLKTKPESPAKGLSSLAELTFLGAATVGEGRRDYKDNEITPGTYTIRFSLQPQDGDHLGTSEFPYFAVLIPAKSDTEVQGFKTFKAMVKASGKATASGHPLVLSLRPPSSESAEPLKVTTPTPDHKSVQVKLPVKAPDSNEVTDLLFELVVEGKFKG